jgi:hypothetical protein
MLGQAATTLTVSLRACTGVEKVSALEVPRSLTSGGLVTTFIVDSVVQFAVMMRLDAWIIVPNLFRRPCSRAQGTMQIWLLAVAPGS